MDESRSAYVDGGVHASDKVDIILDQRGNLESLDCFYVVCSYE